MSSYANDVIKMLNHPTVLLDPEIAVRRKVVFLLNALLTPTLDPTTSQSPNPSSQSSTTTGPSLHTVDEPRPNNPQPIHANPHAAHLKDPSRNDTSKIVRAAFDEHAIADAVVSALIDPLPYGEDGDQTESDTDFEEKALQ